MQSNRTGDLTPFTGGKPGTSTLREMLPRRLRARNTRSQVPYPPPESQSARLVGKHGPTEAQCQAEVLHRRPRGRREM